MKIQLSSIAKNDILLYARKYKSDDSSLGQKFLEEIKLKAIQISENPEQSEIIYENIRIIALDSFPINLHYTFEKETETVFTCRWRKLPLRSLSERRRQMDRSRKTTLRRRIIKQKSFQYLKGFFSYLGFLVSP